MVESIDQTISNKLPSGTKDIQVHGKRYNLTLLDSGGREALRTWTSRYICFFAFCYYCYYYYSVIIINLPMPCFRFSFVSQRKYSYFKNRDGVIFVFDITRRETFVGGRSSIEYVPFSLPNPLRFYIVNGLFPPFFQMVGTSWRSWCTSGTACGERRARLSASF